MPLYLLTRCADSCNVTELLVAVSIASRRTVSNRSTFTSGLASRSAPFSVKDAESNLVAEFKSNRFLHLAAGKVANHRLALALESAHSDLLAFLARLLAEPIQWHGVSRDIDCVLNIGRVDTAN